MELPGTRERVTMNTAERTNQRIQQETEMRLWYYAMNPDRIDERLRELEEEWDMERTLEANAATLAFTGTALGLLGSKRYLLIPAIVTGFLLQHATQGWCPPVPLFRRLGIRTQSEIEGERYALKALRGDFQAAAESGETHQRIARTLQVVKPSMGMTPETRLH